MLDGFETRTCYLGLAFYHKKDFYKDDVFTSMAHIYKNNYDGMVLKGEKAEFTYDKELASKISSLIHLTDEEINDIAPTPADKEKLVELIAIINDASKSNKEKADAIRNIAGMAEIAVGLMARVI